MGLGDILNYIIHGCISPNGFQKVIAGGEIPFFTVSAQEIFSNEIELFDVNFFNPLSNDSTAGQLQETIAKWYVNLRDIAIVASLSILVYIGIKILISSTSSDKAKYKQMIMDWLIGLCLIFVMHYIMSFSNTIVNKVTELVKNSVGNSEYILSVYTDDWSNVADDINDMDFENDLGDLVSSIFNRR